MKPLLIFSLLFCSTAALAGTSLYAPNALEDASASYLELAARASQPAVAPSPGVAPAPVAAPSGPDTTTLTASDLTAMADGIAQSVAALTPAHYNDVVRQYLIWYHDQPGSRAAIEELLTLTAQESAEEIAQHASESPVITILEDVVTVTSAAYAIYTAPQLISSMAGPVRSLGRVLTFQKLNLLATKQISDVPQFQGFVAAILKKLPEDQARRLCAMGDSVLGVLPKSKFGRAATVVGIGGAYGVAHAVFEYMQSYKIDPRKLLKAEQGLIVDELGREVASYKSGAAQPAKGRLKEIKSEIDVLRASSPELMKRGPGDATLDTVDEDLSLLAPAPTGDEAAAN